MDETDKVKVVVRWIFAIWIIVLGSFIFISSVQVYRATGEGESTKNLESIEVPSPPNFPVLKRDDKLYPKVDDQVKVWQQEIAAYEKQVGLYEKRASLYEKQVSAYKTRMEIAADSGLLARYKAVVTDTLVVYLGGGFFTTFLSWIFANLAAGAVERFTQLRQQRTESAESIKDRPLKPIKLL